MCPFICEMCPIIYEICPFICKMCPFIYEICPFICEMCPFFNEIPCKVVQLFLSCCFFFIFGEVIVQLVESTHVNP